MLLLIAFISSLHLNFGRCCKNGLPSALFFQFFKFTFRHIATKRFGMLGAARKRTDA